MTPFSKFHFDEKCAPLVTITGSAMAIVDIEAEMASIFSATGCHEFAQQFPLRRKPPLNATGLFANVASSPEELVQLILEPAAFLGDSRYIGFAVYEYDAQMSRESVMGGI